MTHRPLVLALFDSLVSPSALPTTSDHCDTVRQITVLPDGTSKALRAGATAMTTKGVVGPPGGCETSVALLPGCEAVGLC